VKNSKKCPKCKSSDIVRVPGDIRGYGAGNNITVGWTIFNAVKVTRYLCATCGFSEEWIDSPTDIAKVKAKYGSQT
jgi:transposase-like protein